jgi:Calcineurin-like phosphoesterase
MHKYKINIAKLVDINKLPWFVFLAFLLLALFWRAMQFSEVTLLIPGGTMLCSAAILMILSLRIDDESEARFVWVTGTLSILLGLIFLNSELLAPESLTILVGVWYVASLLVVVAYSRQALLLRLMIFLVGALAGGLVLYLFHRSIVHIAIGIAFYEVINATRKLSMINWKVGREALRARLDDTMDNEISRRFASLVASYEPLVRHIDGLWLLLLTVVLFEIHLSRMGFQGDLGMLPAVIALIGDFIMALVISFLVVLPLRMWWIRVFSRYEGRAISIIASRRAGSVIGRLVQTLFIRQLRWKIRLAEARYSIPALLWQGLISGLPVVFIITATVPLLGMNWFYDTEKWASIARDKWAALNTDRWRVEMVKAANPEREPILAVDVPGVGNGKFSFIVVGDPGQGGLAQRELAKQIVRVSMQPDVRFLLISSDVVYPNGEMQDYEERFWSPYSGLTLPILAIPGNHDWYDGLDAFAATFFTKEAARAAISARDGGGADADDIEFADSLIARVQELKQSYGLTVQMQTSPYFQIVTDHFVLICVDTGVVPGVDQMQMQWLRKALEAARGKTTMVLLGHPFFALNRDMTLSQRGLQPILELLHKEQVTIAMAGDTHDLEYYLEALPKARSMHHFVNGGGGAFLTIGSSFGVPSERITEVWAHYPTRQAITDMLNANLPAWLMPLWWWTQKFDGYPFSSDVLSTAFDFDRSPFLNSFLLVEVDSEKRQIRVVPYGVKGRLLWSDLARSESMSVLPQREAEWVIPMDNSSQ